MSSKSAQVYLRELIQVGALGPGEEFDPVEMAARLGLEATSLAGAAANLEAFGLLERSRIGYRVRIPSMEELGEFVKMRLEIEARAAESLARSAQPEDLLALRSEIAGQRMAALKDERLLFMDASARFHQMLARRANFLHGARVLETWEDYQQIVGLRALQDRDAMLEAVHEHEAMLNCIEGHDGLGAAAAVRHHLRRTLDRLATPLQAV